MPISPSGAGLLLVGHGTREAVGRDEFLAAARLVADRFPLLPVEPCFLEFCQPTISEGFKALTQRVGVRQVVVVPVLLFSAGHAQRDIPEAVAVIARGFPWISVSQCPHLGCHPQLLELSRLRYDEALAARQECSTSATGLILVGRGSHDAGATAEMREFTALQTHGRNFARVQTAFVAMAEPRLEAVLEDARSWPVRRVVVQPHLLFGGVLLDRIAQQVAEQAARAPEIEWLATAHLGPQVLLADAILGRAIAWLDQAKT